MGKDIQESNYITIRTVKKSLSTIDGKLTIDYSIISPTNKRSLDKLLKPFQKRFEKGMSLDMISEKLHFLFNWRIFEYQPVEESLEKYLYLKNYHTKMELEEDTLLLNYIEGKIDYYKKNRPKS